MKDIIITPEMITLATGVFIALLAYIKKIKEIHSAIAFVYKYVIKKIFHRNKQLVDLKKHFIFTDIENTIKYKIPNVKYVCKLRKELFTTILVRKLETFRYHLHEIIDLDPYELNKKTKEELQEMFDISIVKWQSYWKEQCLNDGVFPFIIDQYIQQSHTTDEIYKKLVTRTILSDIIYENNVEKVFSILTSLSVVYILLLLDMEEVFTKINGQLLDKSYNGIACRGYQLCGVCRKLHKGE